MTTPRVPIKPEDDLKVFLLTLRRCLIPLINWIDRRYSLGEYRGVPYDPNPGCTALAEDEAGGKQRSSWGSRRPAGRS